MLEQHYLATVRRALFQRGVWGAEARRIIEQLADHHRTMVAELEEGGSSQAEAESKTQAALGAADVLAESAAANLRSRRWLSRHPWLLAGGGVFVATLAAWAGFLAAVVLAAKLTAQGAHKYNYGLMEIGASWSNFVPFLASCMLLGLWARRASGSWKSLLIASVALGLASSGFSAGFTLTDSPHPNYYLNILVRSWVSLPLYPLLSFYEPVRNSLPSVKWSAVLSQLPHWKLLLPPLVVLAARYGLPRWRPAK